MKRSLPPRRWLLRGALALVVCVLGLGAVGSALSYEPTRLGPGAVDDPANGTTVVSVQGFHFQGVGNRKKPARLVAAGPRATTEWVHDGSAAGSRWFYDVDPLADGNLLVTSTVPGDTAVYEYDPKSDERVWTERFDAADTHDVDLINGDQLLVANMRATNGSGVPNDRLFVYDRSKDEIVWEWTLRKHFPKSMDGGYSADWSHLNDVDKIGEGRYLASPRNFDQAIVVNRTTGAVTMRLGSDGNHSKLFEQHNPDYLKGRNGTPTLLVADSENDRVVEYRRQAPGNWTRTWTLTGFDWPRDADRLPNGNTLITDTLNQRVVEVTPSGEVVWEYYAPWAPYDAERLSAANHTRSTNASVGGSHGPTIAELNATGSYALSDSGGGRAGRTGFPTWVAAAAAGTPLKGVVQPAAERYAHVAPFVRPVWLSSWGFAALLGALLLASLWGLGEVVHHRHRLRRAIACRLG